MYATPKSHPPALHFGCSFGVILLEMIVSRGSIGKDSHIKDWVGQNRLVVCHN